MSDFDPLEVAADWEDGPDIARAVAKAAEEHWRRELAEARGEVARLRGMLRDASAGLRRFGSLLRLIGKQDDNAGALVEGNTAYERADEIDAALTPPPATPEEYERRMRELRPHTEAERERLRQQVRVSPGFMRTTFRSQQ